MLKCLHGQLAFTFSLFSGISSTKSGLPEIDQVAGCFRQIFSGMFRRGS